MTRSAWIVRCLSLAACISIAGTAVADEKVKRRVSYNRDIRPLLSDRCFRCHGPDAAHREADVRLDRREDVVADRQGSKLIVPGQPSDSEVYRRITSTEDDRMPPADSGSTLSASEIELLQRWIEDGAEYEPHWAFMPPKSSSLPKVRRRDWAHNPIDHFVLAELERRKLKPSPDASRETLLRRATLDLTGLPPTLAELDAFLADTSPDAYERAIDRLLQSPHYGERMALDWLDAARYADTNGYYYDSERNSWPWRDWIINAFNANMPFDRFTIEQLAGDLLPNPTREQQIATGFNRNHMVTNETGIIEEEFRTSYVVDRVDTTSTVWLGMTVGCARCHDHKYDPIAQREYYQLFAFFNNIAEKGLVSDTVAASPPPNLELPTAEQEKSLAALRAQRAKCETAYKKVRPELSRALAEWEPTALESLPPLPTEGTRFHFNFENEGDDHGPLAAATSTSGELAFVPGVRGQASKFDGTQYVEFSNVEGVERDRPFSLSVWIKPGSTPSGCVISKMDSTTQARGFEIIWYKSQPRINFVHQWGSDTIEIVAKEKFSGAQWRHLVVSYDGSGKAAGMKLFVDGVPSKVAIRSDTLTGSTASSEPWRIAWKGTGVGFDGGIDELRFYDRPLDDAAVNIMYWRDMLTGAVETPRKDRSKQQNDKLEAYYISHHGTPELQSMSQELASLKSEEDVVMKEILSTSVMHEMENERETHLLMRGQYDQLGDKVEPSVPAALGSLSADAPRNRLGLAQWLVSSSNPLTARVAVNRCWQQVFGEGLVRTMNDFGLQGEQPTNAELLDWLATDFMQSGWDVKRLMKQIVTSATYRQSSNFTKDLRNRDPDNRLLARGPRYRLPAELLRDQALAMSGLLVPKIGGPSVKPYQPPGLWEAVSYNGDQTYVADHGESLYRRGLYTFWKRQAPPPDMLTFDGPTRETCTVRRPRTNTPLQALLLLNETAFVEASRALATRMLREGGSDANRCAEYGFRTATGRAPGEADLTVLKDLWKKELAQFQANPQSASALLKVGDSPADASLDPCELAAWTMVANVLLNLDEVVTQH